MTPPIVSLDIFSDPVCPWCYIGKAYLDRALESRPQHPFQIAWHPFRLNPDLPPEGAERGPFLEAKFGDRRKAAEVAARVQAAADEAGVPMDIARATRMPNTIDAHRLIHWAGLEGAQTRVVDALFRAYFREGLDIGSAEVLVRIAEDCGMDAAVVARLLESDADRDDMLARDMDARQKGVSAVPTFLIDRRFVVPGAQPVETWTQVIDEIIEKLDAE